MKSKHVHLNIKAARIMQQKSTEEMAERLCISERQYRNIENGKVKIDIERLNKILAFLDIQISDVL